MYMLPASIDPSGLQNFCDRVVDGIAALFLALKRRPVIRYQRTSDIAKRVAQETAVRGFGEATMSCLQHLSGFIGSQQVRLVTLSGGVGPYMTGIGQLDAACSVSMIPAPLRVSSADVAEILRRESSVRDVILAATAADAAVVGIGAIDQRRDATILRSGYISEGEQLMYARKGAVGDILGYFLQADGKPVEGLEIHRELLGVTLDELAQLPTIVGVAGGTEKAQAIYAALIGKRINGLVTEETTARAVLTLAS